MKEHSMASSSENDTLGKFAADLRELGVGKASIDDLIDPGGDLSLDWLFDRPYPILSRRVPHYYAYFRNRYGNDVLRRTGRRVWPSRSALFAALSGRTLPSKNTLAFLVVGWADPSGVTWPKREKQACRQVDAWEGRRVALKRASRQPGRPPAPPVVVPLLTQQRELGQVLREAVGNHDLDELAGKAAIPRRRLESYLAGKAIPGDSPLTRLGAALADPRYSWEGSALSTKFISAADQARRARASARRKAHQEQPATGDPFPP